MPFKIAENECKLGIIAEESSFSSVKGSECAGSDCASECECDCSCPDDSGAQCFPQC